MNAHKRKLIPPQQGGEEAEDQQQGGEKKRYIQVVSDRQEWDKPSSCACGKSQQRNDKTRLYRATIKYLDQVYQLLKYSSVEMPIQVEYPCNMDVLVPNNNINTTLFTIFFKHIWKNAEPKF